MEYINDISKFDGVRITYNSEKERDDAYDEMVKFFKDKKIVVELKRIDKGKAKMVDNENREFDHEYVREIQ